MSNLPVAIMLLGGVVKIFTNYHVVVVPSMGIYGAPRGNILCFALCMVLDLVVIARGDPPGGPLISRCSPSRRRPPALMGLGAWAVYGLLSKVLMAAGKLCEAGSGHPEDRGPEPDGQRSGGDLRHPGGSGGVWDF